MYKELIEKLKGELASKNAPGPILDGIMFGRLDKFASKFNVNNERLMIGALLADIRIDEAKSIGDIEKHVDMALEYAVQLFEEYEIGNEDREIITEIIATHHGGVQRFVESKVFKNADNFKFLETRGCFHFFGALYSEHTVLGLENVVNEVKTKLNEKLELTDLDTETIEEANELYGKNLKILNDILKTP